MIRPPDPSVDVHRRPADLVRLRRPADDLHSANDHRPVPAHDEGALAARQANLVRRLEIETPLIYLDGHRLARGQFELLLVPAVRILLIPEPLFHDSENHRPRLSVEE